MDESPIKAEDGVERKPSGYKSWKKKYRKMRIAFDQKMQHGEELHKREAKASATVKRLAIENDRLLDLLLDINDSPQIPFEKRINIALKPSSETKGPTLPIDRDSSSQKEEALKRLEQLLNDVPHTSYSAAKESNTSYVTDLIAADGETHPANFLSADDIDNYTYHVDNTFGRESFVPRLASHANISGANPTNPHLKNPTSVTNWLRKHAPKIFLQDGEGHADGEDADSAPATGRKSRGGRGERGGRASTRGKRGSGRAALDRGDGDTSMVDDADFGSTPVGRGKRKRDEDAGYRPRGSSSRPIKKKRKSEADGTPTVRRSKKEIAANKAD